MHAAALPPIQPTITDADRAHARFPEYQVYRSFCSTALIEASAFKDWLRQSERQESDARLVQSPSYPEFLAWMRKEQGGRRKCPAGAFPANFIYWMAGGRW